MSAPADPSPRPERLGIHPLRLALWLVAAVLIAVGATGGLLFLALLFAQGR